MKLSVHRRSARAGILLATAGTALLLQGAPANAATGTAFFYQASGAIAQTVNGASWSEVACHQFPAWGPGGSWPYATTFSNGLNKSIRVYTNTNCTGDTKRAAANTSGNLGLPAAIKSFRINVS